MDDFAVVSGGWKRGDRRQGVGSQLAPVCHHDALTGMREASFSSHQGEKLQARSARVRAGEKGRGVVELE